jgi:hypothetical protein
MALLHRATMHPTKRELLAGWLPGRDWYRERPDADVAVVASYRFDDPAGAVGIETLLVRAGDGPTYQVPLCYRGAPLDDGDRWLIGNTAHSVLGKRWVYDGCGDPVYVSTLASAIFGETRQADEFFEVDGAQERRERTIAVTGSGGPGGRGGAAPTVAPPCHVVDGDPTLIVADAVQLAVIRRLGDDHGPAAATLTGTWGGRPDPLPLAYATLR